MDSNSSKFDNNSWKLDSNSSKFDSNGRLSCEYYIHKKIKELSHMNTCTNSKNIHGICMYVIMRKWTCIESNIWVMDEYGFSIMSA